MACKSKDLEEDKKRFLAKVKKSNSCWFWLAAKNKAGYGRFGFRGAMHLAHRVSYVIFVGEIKQRYICHTCDNPSCVNPKHLFAGTQADNIHDMINKNRFARGERNGLSKLRRNDILKIRRKYSTNQYSQKELAGDFGIHQSLVSYIVRRKIWKHI